MATWPARACWCERDGDNYEVDPSEVDYIDVSPRQIVGVSASLIPFLEHDDANRALMGSNMQRQAVPLLITDPPVVGTGMEKVVAGNTEMVMRARKGGTVRYADSQVILVDDEEYKLTKFRGLNERTCQTHRPRVMEGDEVEVGQLLADGASTRDGELALGQNLLVAFMTWDGFNYEDAILVSERLVRDDVFTSIHIEEYEVEIRETKLGKEEFTPRHPERGRARPREPGRQRHRPRRNVRGGRRHPRRQGRAEVEERAHPRGEAAARDLRPRRSRREERLPDDAPGHDRGRDRRPEVLPSRQPDRRRAKQGPEPNPRRGEGLPAFVP